MGGIPLCAAATALSLLAFVAAAACSSANEYAPGGGGAPACDTCANVYTNGGIACGPGPSTDAWEALALCACDEVILANDAGQKEAPCQSACTASFCQSLPADMTCGTCLAMSCAAQVSACGSN